MKRSLITTMLALVLIAGTCVVNDTTNPVVTIVVPANNAVLAPGTITIKAVATDNKAIARVEFFAGAAKIGEDATASADTFDVSWTVSTEGSYTLKVVAWDKSDNTAEHSISVTIQTGGGGTGPTYHENDIVGGDSVWYPSGNPHIVKNNLDINQNGKLTIMPGCVVKFNTGAGFRVGQTTPGELVAIGKPDSGIVFTSNAATPNAGDWLGFDFYEETRTSSQLSYCDVNYAGWENYGAVNIEWSGSVRIDHTTIRNAPKYGIWFGGDNGYIAGFTGNTITGCGGYPIYIRPGKLSKLMGGNTLTGNAKNGIYVTSGNVTETGEWVNQGVPFVIGGSVSVGSADGAFLTIGKGATVKMGVDNHIAVGHSGPGGLKADSVVFTSAAATPQRGDWDGIWFYERSTDAECRLTNCIIEFGGGDGYGNVWIEDALPTITGCHIAHSASWGIYLSGADYPNPDELENNNTWDDNVSGNVRRP
uniref:Right handed beta helix domain-containing protein n=1 Tax=candidate division WOR-3 bacterium TaxID=2052148 RepID=A0A7C4GC40_UNCW3